MVDEEWREIKGFEGLYAVSNLGNVKRLRHSDTRCRQGYRVFKERRLVPHIRNGYYQIKLSKCNAAYAKSVHRLVAEAFILNDDPKRDQVNHKDGNKLNNNVKNLEWCTGKENVMHAVKNGLMHFGGKKAGKSVARNRCKKYDPFEIKMIISNMFTIKELSRMLGRTESAIQHVRCNYRNYFDVKGDAE